MAKVWRILAIGALTAMLAGCGGWYLRGKGPHQPNFSNVYVNAAGASHVGDAVKNELYNRRISVISSPIGADLVVTIETERFDRRILSVDPDTGKVREIELGLEAYFSVRTGDGRLLIPREPLTWQLDYVFDEVSLLGTVAQDQTVQLDLAKIAATTLVLRLQTIQIPPPAGPQAPITASEFARGAPSPVIPAPAP